MNMKKNYSSHLFALVVLMAFCVISQTAGALGQKELQQLLDEQPANLTRADGAITEIDISSFTEPYTTTLYVRNQSVRFVNGTLRRAASLTGPLIMITNGYTLELPASATLSGNDVRTGYPIVEIDSGTLTVDGGSIIKPDIPEGTIMYTTDAVNPDNLIGSDRPIKLTSDNAHLVMKSGTVEGEITCLVSNADVQILGGMVKWLGGYHVTTRSDVHINPNVCNRIYTTKDKKNILERCCIRLTTCRL